MAVPVYDHIVVVVMENHDYGQIIGGASGAPYLNSLAANGALLSNYRGITHPSEPNYLALYAGSTFGITDDRTHKAPGPTLATILQGAGKTFAGYVERQGRSHDHNPWETFPEGRSVERDFDAFPRDDFVRLPTVSFVIPGVHHDMHDGTVSQGDQWVEANIGPYANWATTHNSLLIVTWDESSSDANNHVPAILYGAHVATGTYPAAYNHYNILSTVLAASKLSGPRSAAAAPPVEIFTPAPAPGQGKAINSSVAGPIALTLADTPLSVTASGTITATGQGVDAVDGPAGNGWVVVNDGTIASSAGLSVALTGSGTVVNGPAHAAAAIIGAAAAVKIEQRPSSVTNSGSISATGTGVDLRDGGSVTNRPAASLHGDQFGLFITGAPGTVANGGQITGTERIGVDLAQGGSIANAAGASIAGKVAGVFFAGGEAELANAGRISATGAAGVDIESGGRVTNQRDASIGGADFGIFVAGGPGSITNQGTIAGTEKFGVDLTVGGSVTNLASASINSAETGIGVYGGQGKVTNQGTISGGTAAVRFSGSGNLLVAGPAAVFKGGVVGGSTVGNTLELAGGNGAITGRGAGAGSVTANGHNWSFSNFDILKVDQGGAWMLSSGLGAQTIVNNGTITISGTVQVPMLDSEEAGLFQLGPGTELHVASAVGAKARIRFLGDGRLVLDEPGTFGSDVGKASYRGPELQGFRAGNAVVLTRFPPSKVVLSYDPSLGILMISNDGHVATLVFQTPMAAGEVFLAEAEGADRTVITRKRIR